MQRSLLKRVARFASAALLLGGLGLAGVAGQTASASSKSSITYTLRFVNGTVISGTATSNDTLVAGAGGTSVTNPTGMTVHVSCSDPFTGGWGVKAGPRQSVDTAWQLKSFYIVKGDKTCGTAVPNVVTREVTDSDMAHWTSQHAPVCVPKIGMKLSIGGFDANTPPGPSFPAGYSQTLTYVATNTGTCTLINVWVNDMHRGRVECPKTTLNPGESMTCTSRSKSISAGPGFHQARAMGTANGVEVLKRDPVYWTGT
jgi:hypothetical protein